MNLIAVNIIPCLLQYNFFMEKHLLYIYDYFNGIN